MFDNFFSKTFYGNTILDWFITAGIILVSLVVAKLLYLFISKVIKRLTRKTETKLDDIIVDKIEEPLVFGFVIAGIWYGLNFLTQSEGFGVFIHKVYYILIIFNVTWMFVRLLDALVEEYIVPAVEKSNNAIDDQILPLVRKGIRITLWLVAAILAVNNAGYDVGALIAGLGIGGLAFALAAQDLVKNLFGGFTIFTDKPFAIGERIKVAGYDGTIEDIGIRSIRMRTLEGRTVIIPNSDVANGAIENVTSEPSRKVVSTLGLTYDMDDTKIQQAIDILKDIAANNDKLLEIPLDEDAEEGAKPEKKIIVAFSGFGDFSLNVLFIYYIQKDESYITVQNDINFSILREFNKNKIEMAFPTQTIITNQAN